MVDGGGYVVYVLVVASVGIVVCCVASSPLNGSPQRITRPLNGSYNLSTDPTPSQRIPLPS